MDRGPIRLIPRGLAGGGKTLKITAVAGNNRRRVFEVRTRRGTLSFPYSECDPAPSPDDRLARVYVDAELGGEGFTYTLESGAEGTVHLDSVLGYNRDPSYMAEMALYRLTAEAREKFTQSPLSAREVARRLGTSPAQLYRLLDPTNDAKSMKQMLSLLSVLGFQVDLTVIPCESKRDGSRTSSHQKRPSMRRDVLQR